MTRFSALLLPLLMLIGCDQGPLMKCDYCRTARYEVRRYICDKCKKPHAACDSERGILNYSKNEGLRGSIYYSATSILTCPAPPEGPEPVSEKPEPSPEDPKTFTATQRGALVGLLVVVSLLLGYGLGKARRSQLIKLENKKGVVS